MRVYLWELYKYYKMLPFPKLSYNFFGGGVAIKADYKLCH